MANHEIIVGNIGTVYSGSSANEAKRNYTIYKDLSTRVYGRASGEDVTWFIDNEIHQEYIGTLHQEDTDNE